MSTKKKKREGPLRISNASRRKCESRIKRLVSLNQLLSSVTHQEFKKKFRTRMILLDMIAEQKTILRAIKRKQAILEVKGDDWD